MKSELKDILDMLNEKGKNDLKNGVSNNEITKFENDNNIKLPDEYKEWLNYSDGGELLLPAGVQLFGVASKPLISKEDFIPEKYYEIGELSTGDSIVCENDSNKVSIYNLEGDCIEDDEIYSDFYAFLNDLPNIVGIDE